MLSSEMIKLDGMLMIGSAGANIGKTIKTGIELIAAVSAALSLAVGSAEKFNIILCGFLRHGRINVYTHSKRISGSK